MPCYFCPYLLVLVILLWSFLLIFLSWSFGPRFLSCLLSWFFLSVFLSCLLSFLCHGLSVLFLVMVYLSCSVSWYFFLLLLPRLFVLFIWTCYYWPVFFPVLIFLSCSDLSIPCAQVPRSDGRDEKLGLIVLDEPAAEQADPTVLDLQLRVVTKEIQEKGL